MKGSQKLVKLLLAKGYRLSSNHFQENHLVRSTWTDLPFRVAKERVNLGDEVYQLHILRAMAKPSYILGQYMAVCEQKKLSKRSTDCEDHKRFVL